MLTASAGLRDRLAPFHRSVVFVPNGVDVNRFHPTENTSTSPVVLYVGLLSPRKGVVDLMKASQALRDKGIEHRLILLGGRPDEGDEAEAEVRAAAPSYAELPGSVPYEEVPQRMADADIFCLPSWYEAMPISILEAMASGLPVVATAVGQIPEVVDDEVGELVPPNDPQQLGNALEGLLLEPELRQRKGAAARDRVAKGFSLDEGIDRIESVYREVTE